MKLSQEHKEELKQISVGSEWKSVEALQGLCLNKMEQDMMSVRLEDGGAELYRKRLMLDGAKTLVKMINDYMIKNRKDADV